jgi:hypothetical protein
LSGGRRKFQPQEYIEYFEDWNLSPAVGGMCHLTPRLAKRGRFTKVSILLMYCQLGRGVQKGYEIFPRLSRRVNNMAVFRCFQDVTWSVFQQPRQKD